MHGRREDLPVFLELPEGSWRAVDWGDMHVSFEVYEQEMDDRPLLARLPGGRCRCPHWGYVIRGSFRVFYEDREEHVVAGEAYHLAPGHAIVVSAGTELVEFSPREAFAAHLAAVADATER